MTNATTAPVTVALVHGAFADSSSWAGVIERLQPHGVPVHAIVNPLRGVAVDSAYVASALRQIPGPVLAVAHSYGGAAITNAASMDDNVRALVYVAAFAPDEGETLQDIESRSADTVLAPALQPTNYPSGGSAPAQEVSIDPDQFHQVFAADVPPERAAVMAATQRPLAASAFGEKTGQPAWKKLPSWAVVATGDKVIGADVVRSMAQRAGAQITEIDASHVVMVSQPDAVATVIRTARSAIS